MSLLANGIFATDAASADVNSDKSGLPVWPAENPTRVQLEAWFEVAQPWLTSKGFSAFIRGDTLRENIKLVDRVVITVPTDAAAAVAANEVNAKITSQMPMSLLTQT